MHVLLRIMIQERTGELVRQVEATVTSCKILLEKLQTSQVRHDLALLVMMLVLLINLIKG